MEKKGERLEELERSSMEGSDSSSSFKTVRRVLFRSAAWLGIYLVGYFNFSLAWLLTPLMLTVLRGQWKKERDFRLSAARQAALTDERTVIESRFKPEDLPSWVFFPDKERAEWINSIVKQLWPNVGRYVRKIIAESVEPSVKSALEGYGLSGFRFDKVSLGAIPPRVTGVKAHDRNVDRNEIILDLDVVLASDCDVKFSVKGISAKVSDFSLRGMLRLVLKPLVDDVPLVGGVQVYFLTSPEVDFDLGGIGNVLDAPGLSSVIRKIVLEQLGAFVVLPNKFTMSLAQGVDGNVLKRPDSAGVLRVHLKRAEKLPKADVGILGMGKSDAYATLAVGARKLQTPRIDNTINPEWDFVGDFPIEVVQGQQLSLEVYDHDDPGEDEFLGRATVATGLVASKGRISDMWVELEDTKTGRALLSLTWLEVCKDVQDEALLNVYVDSCRDLVRHGKSPCPVVVLSLGSGDSQSTLQQNHTLNPAFEQGFVFVASNLNAEALHVKVVDGSKKGKDVLGKLTIRISDLVNRPNMEIPLQPLPFTDGGQGSISLSAQAKPLRKPEVEEVPDDFVPVEHKDPMDSLITEPPSLDTLMSGTVDPIIKTAGFNVEAKDLLRRRNVNCAGRLKLTVAYDRGEEELKVTVHEAEGLPGGDLPDPPDPYVKLYLLPDRNKKSKRKSEAKRDTVQPVYEETFAYSNMTAGDVATQQLEVTVVDKKGIFARGSLMGRAVVDLSKALESPFTEWMQLEEADSESD